MSAPPGWRQVLKVSAIIVGSLVVIGGLVVAYPFIYAMGAGRLWDKQEPELHFLTPGYIGPVLIVLNDTAGSPCTYDHGTRIYRIPANGVLRSQCAPNEGWGLPDYEYLDSAGTRTRIYPGAPCEDSLPGDQVQACLMGRKFANGRAPEYSAYIVGREGDRATLWERGDSLVDAVLFPDSLQTTQPDRRFSPSAGG